MVVYTVGGQRRVAHAASSQVRSMDCKQAFLNTLQVTGATLHGWFRPYLDAKDFNRKSNAFKLLINYMGGNINKLTTFGIVTGMNRAYSVDAFKPTGIGGNDWVVTHVSHKTLKIRWIV